MDLSIGKVHSSCAKHFSGANAFGIFPYRIHSGEPTANARTWRSNSYRYFIETDVKLKVPGSRTINWQTGNCAAVAGYGVVMVYVSEILKMAELHKLAQRQLDWILGVNPFDASLIVGVGRNQPPLPTRRWTWFRKSPTSMAPCSKGPSVISMIIPSLFRLVMQTRNSGCRTRRGCCG